VFVEREPQLSPPEGATQTSLAQLKAKTGTLPLYKRWQFWAAVGGGVAVLGTGAFFLIRRRKHA
jgi:LPXTG-motif cell wall-anchored protein